MSTIYIKEITNYTSQPRSLRLRELGLSSAEVSVVNTTAGTTTSSSDELTNIATLNEISTDDDRYIYLTKTEKNDDGDYEKVTGKAKSGFADNAGLWDGHDFDDFLDQSLKTTDTPVFKAIKLVNGINNIILSIDDSGALKVNNDSGEVSIYATGEVSSYGMGTSSGTGSGLAEESDPVFLASAAYNITSDLISEWNTAYTNSHTHSNKSVLDLITSTYLGHWNTAYSHISNTENPHSVTKSQVGLGNVDNTADSDKVVLSASKLTAAKTIWGQSFDGSANVSGALSNVTTISASSYIESESLKISPDNEKAIISTSDNSYLDLRPNYSDTFGVIIRAYNDTSNYGNIKVVGGYLSLSKNSGTPHISIFDSGNVSIGGTSDAGYKLDVAGGDVIIERRLFTRHIDGKDYDDTSKAGDLFLQYFNYTNYINFCRSKMFLNGSTGNLGIGTTAPAYRLDVNGTLRTTDLAAFENGIQIGSIKLVYDSTNNAIKVIGSDGSDANFYTTGESSAFGLGTSSGSGSGLAEESDPVFLASAAYNITSDLISEWNTAYTNSHTHSNKSVLDLITSTYLGHWNTAYSHISNTENPHSVTKSQVGLGNVDNTADSDKVVLSASKLTTARTIAGISFNGTANISIPFANLSSIPTTLSGYGITDYNSYSPTLTGTGASGIWGISITGNASTATKLYYINTSFTGTYPVTVNVGGTIYSHTGLTYNGSTHNLTSTNFTGTLYGNATTATTLATSRNLWGQSFNGSANISGALTGVTSITATGAISTTSTLTVSSLATFNAGIQIGSIKLLYDSDSNAIKIVYFDGTTSANLYTTGEISSYGMGTSSASSGGMISTVYASSYLDDLDLDVDFDDTDTDKTFNAYSIKKIYDIAKDAVSAYNPILYGSLKFDADEDYSIGDSDNKAASIYGTQIYANGFHVIGQSTTGFIKSNGQVDTTTYLTTSTLPVANTITAGIVSTTNQTFLGAKGFYIPMALSYDASSQEDGSIYFCNYFENLKNPTIVGKSSSTYASNGLHFIGLTDDSYQYGDIRFEVRQLDGSDYTTIDDNHSAYRFTLGNTTIMSLRRTGSLYISGALTQNSDIRLKTNIRPIDNALDKVAKIRGIIFDWKEANKKKNNIGVIAQELKEVVPELVNITDEEKGTLGVEYANMSALLIEAVKELNNKINTLINKNQNS